MPSATSGNAGLCLLFACAQSLAQAPTAMSDAEKVIAGLGIASNYKTTAVEYFNRNHRFPNSNEELAIAPVAENPIVQRIEVSTPDANSRTVITVTFGRWAGANNVLTMTGWAMSGGIQFTCGGAGSTLADELRPAACKVTG